jgi:peptidoglycan/LPS O-acetylase OafA/YrhL
MTVGLTVVLVAAALSFRLFERPFLGTSSRREQGAAEARDTRTTTIAVSAATPRATVRTSHGLVEGT